MEKKTDFKALSSRAKVQYIWDYYKFPIFGALVAVFILGSIIHQRMTYREPLLNVIMINCNDPYGSDASGFDEFLLSEGYDPDEHPISLYSSLQFSDDGYPLSYQDSQVLIAMVAAGGQDLFFGSGDIYLSYAEQGALMDLSTVLPAKTLDELEGHLLYSTDSGESAPYPCAVELTENEWLKKNNYYDTCYFGIFYHTDNPDAAVAFAAFLLDY